MDMSLKEQGTQRRHRKQWTGIYVLTLCAAAAELLVFRGLGFTWEEMADSVLPYVGMLLLFGGWFCIFAKENLPSFYDKNKISFVSDGVFRMNMPGLHFNNSNWPYILNVGRVWTCGGAVLFPIIEYILWRCLGNEMWVVTRLIVPLFAVLSMFIPMYIFGKKYE